MTLEEEIKAITDERLAAMKAGNVGRLGELLADDFMTVSPLGAIQGKSDNLSDVVSGDLKIDSFLTDDYTVRAHGDIAIAAFRNTMTHVFKGQTRSGKYRITSVYMRRKNAWILASNHVMRLD